MVVGKGGGLNPTVCIQQKDAWVSEHKRSERHAVSKKGGMWESNSRNT